MVSRLRQEESTTTTATNQSVQHHQQPYHDNDDTDDVDDDIEGQQQQHSLPHPVEVEMDAAVMANKQKNQKQRGSGGSGGRMQGMLETVAGVSGNVLEWYDFAVFGFFSDILGEVFFPPNQSDDDAAIIEAFAVFGGAFLMRPVGGVLMGYIGDVIGRKKALEISIFLMAFPTFAMGCLPSYDRVGWVAILLLILVRLLQGLSVGGQLMSSLVFTVEGHDRKQWGLYGSFVMAAANFGTLLGGLMGYGMRRWLSHEDLVAWGWRLPFLSGILVSFSGFYLRSCVGEDHAGVEAGLEEAEEDEQTEEDGQSQSVGEGHVVRKGRRQRRRSNPIAQAFERPRALFSCCLVPTIWSAGFYLCFVWMATFMEDLISPAVPGAFAVNSGSLLVGLCLFFPVAGWMSDKCGRVRVMSVGGFLLGVVGPLMMYIIGKVGPSKPGHAFMAQCALGVMLSLWGAPMMAWMVESFPAEARLTSCAIGYNVAQALVGGSAPFIATLLVDSYGPLSPGYYMTLLSCLALTGLLCVAPKHVDAGTVAGGDFTALASGTETRLDSTVPAPAEKGHDVRHKLVVPGAGDGNASVQTSVASTFVDVDISNKDMT